MLLKQVRKTYLQKKIKSKASEQQNDSDEYFFIFTYFQQRNVVETREEIELLIGRIAF